MSRREGGVRNILVLRCAAVIDSHNLKGGRLCLRKACIDGITDFSVQFQSERIPQHNTAPAHLNVPEAAFCDVAFRAEHYVVVACRDPLQDHVSGFVFVLECRSSGKNRGCAHHAIDSPNLACKVPVEVDVIFAAPRFNGHMRHLINRLCVEFLCETDHHRLRDHEYHDRKPDCQNRENRLPLA
uniref:Uncharacterized protein n=1 Tax=Candidatus Methanogaster sp. ANME-2c ERB4 TaxID=2759911 RepID=A0A7G9YAK4_9EURY|nr:hypothetical protein OCBDJLBC_00001 [Methanosarcinales archaeon ANME-2c ERB4]